MDGWGRDRDRDGTRTGDSFAVVTIRPPISCQSFLHPCAQGTGHCPSAAGRPRAGRVTSSLTLAAVLGGRKGVVALGPHTVPVVPAAARRPRWGCHSEPWVTTAGLGQSWGFQCPVCPPRTWPSALGSSPASGEAAVTSPAVSGWRLEWRLGLLGILHSFGAKRMRIVQFGSQRIRD